MVPSLFSPKASYPTFSQKHSRMGAHTPCCKSRSAVRRKTTALDDASPHSEQRLGSLPPSPLEDDGHVVDLFPLKDLFDSGESRVELPELVLLVPELIFVPRLPCCNVRVSFAEVSRRAITIIRPLEHLRSL